MSLKKPLSKWITDIEKRKLSLNFSLRENQKKMMFQVENALTQNQLSIIEAPTGTGKSLGYLIPAFWFLKNQKQTSKTQDCQPIIISTATLTLQNQILNKDIPLALKLINDTSFKTFVLKGRQNYLCQNRLEEWQKRNSNLSPEHEKQLTSILAWSRKTQTGDRGDLNFLPDVKIWNSICGNSLFCQSLNCRSSEKCFFYKNKREASSSHIIIVNHSMLAHDLAIKSKIGLDSDNLAILPNYSKIIVDEAHKLSQSLERAFAFEVSSSNLSKILTLIDPSKTGNLLSFRFLISGEEITSIQNLIKEVITYWKESEDYLLSNFDSLPLQGSFFQKPNFRVIDKILFENPIYKNYLKNNFKSFNSLEKLKQKIDSVKNLYEEKGEWEAPIGELSGFIEEISHLLNHWKVFFHLELSSQPLCGRWLEKTENEKTLHLSLQIYPLEIGSFLNEKIYPHLETIVFTSATLANKNDFSHYLNSFGLVNKNLERRVKTLSLPFPFDPSQVFFSTVCDISPPENTKNYFEQVLPILRDLVKINKGGTLILGTSHSMIQRVSLYLNSCQLQKPIYTQNTGKDLNELISLFKKETQSILIGTDAFWEGIDVPGESLTLVVILKIPFAHPLDPLHYMKRAYLSQTKKLNPFIDYDVPLAIIKFKQGFGRLIRKYDDQGTVVCLDSRICLKEYGKQFVTAIQPYKHHSLKKDIFLQKFKTRNH